MSAAMPQCCCAFSFSFVVSLLPSAQNTACRKNAAHWQFLVKKVIGYSFHADGIVYSNTFEIMSRSLVTTSYKITAVSR